MASRGGNVKVTITGDASGLDRSVGQAESALNRLNSAASKSHDHLSSVGKASDGLTGALGMSVKGLAGMAAGLGALAAAKGAVSTTEELAHQTLVLHQNTGLSTKAAGEWIATANVWGIQTRALNQSFGTLSKGVEGAIGGSKKQIEIFNQLGISTSDLKAHQHDLNFILGQVADGLNKMPAGTQKTADSMVLLGRGWQTLTPLMAGGSKQMQQQLDLANQMGAAMSGPQLKAQEQLIQAQKKWQLSLLGLKVTFTEHVTPVLEKAIGDFTKIVGIINNPNLSGQQKWAQVTAMFSKIAGQAEKAFENIMPKVANSVATEAPRVADAFIHSFMNANGWGKILIGGWLLHKLGGDAAFMSLGKRAAGGVMRGMSGGLASLVPGGQGGAGGVAGSVARNAFTLTGYRGTGIGSALNPLIVASLDPGAGGISLPGGGKTSGLAKDLEQLGGGGTAAETKAGGLLGRLKGLGTGALGMLGIAPEAAVPLAIGGAALGTGYAAFHAVTAKDQFGIPGGSSGIDSVFHNMGIGSGATFNPLKIASTLVDPIGGVMNAGLGALGIHLPSIFGGNSDPLQKLRQFGDNAPKSLNLDVKAGNASALDGLIAKAQQLQKEFPKAGSALQRFIDTADKQKVTLDTKTISNMLTDIQRIRFPGVPQFIQDFNRHMTGLSATGKRQGADAMIEAARSMEQNGRIPLGSTDRLIKQMEAKWPHLTQYLIATGHGSMEALSKEFQSQKVVQNVQSQVNTIEGYWGKMPELAATNGANVYQNWKAALDKVTSEMHTGSAASREAASQEYQKLLSMQDQVTQTLVGHWKNQLDSMQNTTGIDYQTILSKAEGALGQLGLDTNQMLKALGLQPVTWQSIISRGGAAGATTRADLGAHGGQTVGARAVGGYIGMPGAAGGDNIPIVVGEGEAILNRHQQAPVETALNATYGIGLDDLFSSVTRPHYMAKGGRAKFAGGGRVGNLTAMIAAANAINSHHYPYVWGGGHNGSFSGPYDCSGAVSAVLHAGGDLNQPLVAADFMNWGMPGPGDVTLYASPGHVYMSMMGRYFGTSNANAGGGAGWFAGGPRPGFVQRHAPVIGGQITAPTLQGPAGALRSIAQGAINKVAGGANSYVTKQIQKLATATASGQGDFGQFSGGGGSMSFPQIEQLASSVGLPVPLFAWIAEAESSGNPGIINSIGATGLWQIYNHPDLVARFGPMTNPLANAKAAKVLYSQSGVAPWASSRASWGPHVGMARGGRVGKVMRGIKGLSGMKTLFAARGKRPKKLVLPTDAGRRSGNGNTLVLPTDDVRTLQSNAANAALNYDAAQIALADLNGDIPSEINYQQDVVSQDQVLLNLALQSKAPDRYQKIQQAAQNLKSAKDQLEQLKQSLDNNTQTLQQQNQILQTQLQLTQQQVSATQRAYQISQSQYGTLAKAIADVASGQIGGRVGLGVQTRLSAGTLARY